VQLKECLHLVDISGRLVILLLGIDIRFAVLLVYLLVYVYINFLLFLPYADMTEI